MGQYCKLGRRENNFMRFCCFVFLAATMTTKLRRAEPSTKRFSEALQFSVQNRKLSLHRAEERKYCKFDNEKIIGVDEAGNIRLESSDSIAFLNQYH